MPACALESNPAGRLRLASFIDHTLLRPDATPDEVRRVCREAISWGFAAVSINLTHVSLAAEELAGWHVKVDAAIGFPLGATTTVLKAAEAAEAVRNGAAEVDMVINIGGLKAGDHDLVKRDIEAVVESAAGSAVVKVILETCYLTDEEKRAVCGLAREAGADFVKTSTGFGPAGATVEDVRLMREIVGPDMGVKAAGGIGDVETAWAMIDAGANRLGTSKSVDVMRTEQARLNQEAIG